MKDLEVTVAHIAAWYMRTRLDGSMIVSLPCVKTSSTSSVKVL